MNNRMFSFVIEVLTLVILLNNNKNVYRFAIK